MADSGIKKTTVLNSDLPAINPFTEGYDVRYRVISEDKNRTSHWSPIYKVVPDFTYSGGNIIFNKSGSIVQIAWDSVDILKNSTFIRKSTEYDIWVKWDRSDNGDWIYKERIQGTSITLPIPDTYFIDNIEQSESPNRFSIEIYLKGNPITRDINTLLVYSDGPHTV